MATEHRLLVELCGPAITALGKGITEATRNGGFYAQAKSTLVLRMSLRARRCKLLKGTSSNVRSGAMPVLFATGH